MTKRYLIFLLSGFAVQSCAPSLPSPELDNPKPVIEEIVPLKSLPRGWVVNRELLSEWGTSLPATLGIIPDSLTNIKYWESSHTTPHGVHIPVKRASISYEYATRITIERMELQFVNIDYIYSITNHETSHYILESIIKTIELKETGFPQLVSDDVLKHKVLMIYGTPQEFDGVWHRFNDTKTEMGVRIIDDRHLAVDLRGLAVERSFRQAIEEVYSREGIEFKKQQLMEGFDI